MVNVCFIMTDPCKRSGTARGCLTQIIHTVIDLSVVRDVKKYVTDREVTKMIIVCFIMTDPCKRSGTAQGCLTQIIHTVIDLSVVRDVKKYVVGQSQFMSQIER